VVTGAQLRGRPLAATTWNGYGANLSELNQAAAQAGFFNTIGDSDMSFAALPLLAEYQGQYYESLALAMFRAMMGGPTVEPGFPATAFSAPMTHKAWSCRRHAPHGFARG
jgi:adenylate cyclase